MLNKLFLSRSKILCVAKRCSSLCCILSHSKMRYFLCVHEITIFTCITYENNVLLSWKSGRIITQLDYKCWKHPIYVVSYETLLKNSLSWILLEKVTIINYISVLFCFKYPNSYLSNRKKYTEITGYPFGLDSSKLRISFS